MSLNKFSKLFIDLDSNNSINKKIDLLINYFLSNSALNNSWTIFLLIGKSNKRFISGKLLREYYSKSYKLPMWLINTCYQKVGDSAEVISLLLSNKTILKKPTDISLDDLIKNKLPGLNKINEEEKIARIKEYWEMIPKEDLLVFNKILTGTFRIGVSRGIVKKSLSKLANIDESIIAHRLMGEFVPSAKTYNFIVSGELDQKELGYKPYPFQLANTLDISLKNLSVNEYQFEWKYDGIRGQIIKRSKNITIWTRGEELVNNSFPELVNLISLINEDFVIDGEILIWDSTKDCPREFGLLQKRLRRKSPSNKIQRELPISFVIYDLLELNGEDIRKNILYERRDKLEKLYLTWKNKTSDPYFFKLRLTNLLKVFNWDDVENKKNESRNFNTEGLVIKNKNSSYIPGRKKGNWWKYKVDPMQLDAVLIYAKAGSGKRADLYTDYSFALWKDKELTKFASAYSGLNNEEIKELDKWIRKNTIEKFGPVRSVKPFLVFEISFENIQFSTRHKSGIAVRFPRITKWRRDKKIYDADSIENAYKLMEKK